MEYSFVDGIIPAINWHDTDRDGINKDGVTVRIVVDEKSVRLYVGPRDWQWDRETQKLVGCGTSLIGCGGEAAPDSEHDSEPGLLLYPLPIREVNPAGDIHIQSSDIADYSYPPGQRKRYTFSGWGKALDLGIAEFSIWRFE